MSSNRINNTSYYSNGLHNQPKREREENPVQIALRKAGDTCKITRVNPLKDACVAAKNASKEKPSEENRKQWTCAMTSYYNALVENVKSANKAWRAVAKATAKGCFDSAGKVDVTKVDEVIRFWEATNDEHSQEFKVVQHLPSWQLVRDQTLAVLGALVPPKKDENPPTGPNNPTALAAVLEAAPACAACSPVGSEILVIMGCDNPQEAILASLLTPHRQMALPTCSLDSLVNSETFNHPERLAEVYSHLLTTKANEPVNVGTRSMTVRSQEIQNSSGPKEPTLSGADPGYVLVTPNQSDSNRKYIFGLMTVEKQDGTTTVVASARNALAVEGIGIEGDGTYRLRYPIRDLTDLFFADLMQNIYEKCDADEAYINVRSDYFGVAGNMFFNEGSKAVNGGSEEIKDGGGAEYFRTEGGKFSYEEFEKLKEQARLLCENGLRKCVATVFTQTGASDVSNPPFDPDPPNAHLENLDPDLLSKFDGSSTISYPYIIGDRNYLNGDGEACYLAITKVNGSEDKGKTLFTFAEVTYNENKPIIEPKKFDIQWIAFEAESDEECLTFSEETTSEKS